MKISNKINELSSHLECVRKANPNARLALVPTMGNLHAGHLSLVEAAKQQADVVAVSIFVNPMQFAPHEDLNDYPCSLADDIKKLTAMGVDIIFTPSNQTLYPDGTEQHTTITVPTFQAKCCAVSRPHFFTGVATVVMKLLNLFQPQVALFGEKDYQQLMVIKQMVKDLILPIEIIGVPTVREADGLAMSSRNQYLTSTERKIAPQLFEILSQCAKQILEGERNFTHCQALATRALSELGMKVDYVEICSASTLAPASPADKAIVILAAAMLGKTRLIDNVRVER